MLHFLIGLAVCIWIAERVTHWLHERRMRKLDRDYIAWLRPRMAEPQPAPQQPQPPDPEGRVLGVALWSVCCAAIIFGVLLVAH